MQADQLFDPMTGEFRCTFCGSSVEEDEAAMPKKDSRLLLAKFNDQMEKLYDLLRMVEDYKWVLNLHIRCTDGCIMWIYFQVVSGFVGARPSGLHE